MKHIFIINPAAGKADSTNEIVGQLTKIRDLDYQVYITRVPKDATEYIKTVCSENPDTEYRFYACGGDGTINEVANGVMGFENASMLSLIHI